MTENMTYLYHASWSHEFQLYGSNDATCIDEIQHNFLPSILFLLLSLETSSTHSFLSSSFILSLPLSLPLPTSPFFPPSPPSPFLPPSPSSLYQSTQPIHPSLPLLSSLPPFLFLPPFPLFPPSINPPNQYSPLPPFFPILTDSLWRQLSTRWKVCFGCFAVLVVFAVWFVCLSLQVLVTAFFVYIPINHSIEDTPSTLLTSYTALMPCFLA